MSAGARRQPTDAGRSLVAELEYGRHAALVQRRVDGYVGRHRLMTCADLARGFCAASVDGYCIGGRHGGLCHG